jgi:hypothetical protein
MRTGRQTCSFADMQTERIRALNVNVNVKLKLKLNVDEPGGEGHGVVHAKDGRTDGSSVKGAVFGRPRNDTLASPRPPVRKAAQGTGHKIKADGAVGRCACSSRST